MTVEGRAVPKGRPRVTFSTGRAITYTPKRTRAWEEKVAWEYRCQVGATMFAEGEELALHCVFHAPHKSADGDNLFKAVADALQEVAYPNDSAIVEGWFQIKRKGPPSVLIVCMAAES
mgnify:FL=1